MNSISPLESEISFDPDWYLQAYPDVAGAGLDPLAHYLEHGRAEERLPCAEAAVIRASRLLDLNYYIMNGDDVRRAGLDPFDHFCRHGSEEARRPNPYFDPVWYLGQYGKPKFMGAVAHYAIAGEARGMRPSLLFDPVWYRQAYAIPAGVNALAHYLAHRGSGEFSPLPAFDVAYYREKYRDHIRPGRDPFGHYLAVGGPRDFNPAPWFDAAHYRRTRMQGAHAADTPLMHLLRATLGGARAPRPADPVAIAAPPARDPAADPAARTARAIDPLERRAMERTLASPLIDEAAYIAALGGPREDPATIDLYLSHPPLDRPSLTPFFDPVFYLGRHPELRAVGRDPLLHFLRSGLAKSFDPHPLIELAYIREFGQDIAAGPKPDEALAELLNRGLRDPSPYFSVRHYLEQTGEEIAVVGSPLRHYLTVGLERGLTPNPFLDLAWYRQRDEARPQSPLAALRHFVLLGDPRGESPGPEFDSDWYLERYPDIRGASLPPLRHYLAYGQAENRQRAPLQRRPLPSQARHGSNPEGDIARYRAIAARFAAHAEALRPREIEIPPVPRGEGPAPVLAAVERPAVSVLLRQETGVDSTDCLRALADAAESMPLEIVHAASRSRAPLVLLLSASVRLPAATLSRLSACLRGDPRIAAVGPKLIGADGWLEQAGRAVANDGTLDDVGAGQAPNRADFGRGRDVHALSPDGMLIRRDLLVELRGGEDGPLDEEAGTTLCLRLHERGHRIHCAADVAAYRLPGHQPDTRPAGRRAEAAQRLMEEWAHVLRRLNRTRVIAFYLPQFHPTVENDRWWGRGFTEWRNVASAEPSYAGHYQPHVPADLGYYDLRVAEVFRQQAALAARYGVDGFCVYAYYLDGKRMLHEPFEAMLRDPTIQFPFCMCWANENWTRSWDGGDGEILAEQRYDAETLAAVLRDALRMARDPRYITVDGKPVLVVYRPLKLPDVTTFAARARNAFRRAGFPGVHLVCVESVERSADGIVPEHIGFDAAVEFPPQGRHMLAADRPRVVKEGWTGVRFDYAETVLAFTEQTIPPYRRHPAVFPSWDNTARQPTGAINFDGADPAIFQFYVERKLDEMHRSAVGDSRLLFVNAWNEWAEGAHLEPDRAFGHRWLEAMRAARVSRDLL
jgi:hypothetical protein